MKLSTNYPTMVPSMVYSDRAEEAVNFYMDVFEHGEILRKMYYKEGHPGPAGTLCCIYFELFGQRLTAVNGGEYFNFSLGVSLYVAAESQEKIDRYYTMLSEGGEAQPCGWVTDKFGLSWQIVPHDIDDMMNDPDDEKMYRVFDAMLQMHNLDAEKLRAAYRGE